MNYALETLEKELKKQEELYEIYKTSHLAHTIRLHTFQREITELKKAIRLIKEHDQALNFMNN